MEAQKRGKEKNNSFLLFYQRGRYSAAIGRSRNVIG
jgi:hypothetical protein